MIIKFDTELLKLEDEEVKDKVAKIMLRVLDEGFLWDRDNLEEIFPLNEILPQYGIIPEEEFVKRFFSRFEPFFSRFVSEYDTGKLLQRIMEVRQLDAYVTEIHTTYLTTLSVGVKVKQGQIHPDHVLKILGVPSKIIVENAVNDWKFIKGIVDKYKNRRDRKTIYSLIKVAIEQGRLEPEHSGGSIKGQIARIKELTERYGKEIIKHKLMTIFDSDKASKTDPIKDEQKQLIEFIKGQTIDLTKNVECDEEKDLIIWHMLYKRELENYLPLQIILDNVSELSEHQKKDLESKYKQASPEDLDFLKYSEYLENLNSNTSKEKKGISEQEIKKKFPELFVQPIEDFRRDKLEERCKHHKVKIETPNENRTLEDVSELEVILLKIAKII